MSDPTEDEIEANALLDSLSEPPDEEPQTQRGEPKSMPVSYTHLTLPTNSRV